MKIVLDGVTIKTDYQTWYADQIEDAEFEMVECQPELPTEITTR